MKLRTQFFILVGGIIAVPFLVTAFMLFMQVSMDRRLQPVPNYNEMRAWADLKVPQALHNSDTTQLTKNKPEGLDIVVISKDDVITTSTIPELPVGSSANSGALFSYMRANIEQFHFQWDNPHDASMADAIVMLKMPRVRPEEVRFRDFSLQVVMYTAVALLLFSSLMSFFILRSLNGSIQSLEGATRRIAEGDLDFELPARGNDQISSLTRSFDSMRLALKEEYARRSRFIMGVSHDLRTPLGLIQGYVEAIADGYAVDPEAQKKYLSIILDKTRSLEGMVGDLIEFVRMETGQWRMTHRDVPARQFLMEIARRFTEDATILKREFGWSIDVPEDVTVRMDAGLVTRAMENLIGNSIRYTPENGKISLSAVLEGDSVVLSISDTGIGIPAEDLSRIYDPFYRGTNSRREQGFGLGLTTVKSILESHGWNIAVKSEIGMGTTFTLRMPAVKSSQAENQLLT
jgi:signal transduction histidine kinase